MRIRDSGVQESLPWGARQALVNELPDAVLIYLLGSRYCDTDRLATEAWALFGKIEPGWPRVQAILDYTHDRIEFGYQHARADRTASEGHSERKGVCRDFAHLAITLCRCMNIPARYCTGYLGDIGVPADPAPMDFSAWFEVFLDGSWHTVDARHNQPAHRPHPDGAGARRHRCRHLHRLRRGQAAALRSRHLRGHAELALRCPQWEIGGRNSHDPKNTRTSMGHYSICLVALV